MTTELTTELSAAAAGLAPRADDEFGMSPQDFKLAFRNHPAGVSIVSADAGDGPVALTATSVFSISAEPPLLVFSVSRLSSAAATILCADTVVVHLLGADQLDLARLCATSGIDRFADTARWGRLETGEPYFHGVPVWVRGRIVNRFEAGASTVVVVHALEAQLPDDCRVEAVRPLVYHNRAWHGLSDWSKLPG